MAGLGVILGLCDSDAWTSQTVTGPAKSGGLGLFCELCPSKELVCDQQDDTMWDRRNTMPTRLRSTSSSKDNFLLGRQERKPRVAALFAGVWLGQKPPDHRDQSEA